MKLGYRMVDFDFDSLSLQTKQFSHHLVLDEHMQVNKEYDKGLFLGSSESFLEYYEGGFDLDEPMQDVKLTYEYDPKDIISGTTDHDSELVVSSAKLVNASFYNEEVQQKWGFLLDQELIKERKKTFMGGELKIHSGNEYVIRSQQALMSHIVEGDYCYPHNGLGVSTSSALRVIDAYEQGDDLSQAHEKVFIKSLEHAVTMAVTSGLKQQVVVYPVTQGDVHKAHNASECIYSGKPKQGHVFLEVTAEGVPQLPQLNKNGLYSKPQDDELSYS